MSKPVWSEVQRDAVIQSPSDLSGVRDVVSATVVCHICRASSGEVGGRSSGELSVGFGHGVLCVWKVDCLYACPALASGLMEAIWAPVKAQ